MSTGTTLAASDLAISDSTSLAGGSSLGLGLVSFDVAGSALNGPVVVTLTDYPATSLTDPNLNNIPIDTLNNGTITISASAVPEPSSLVMASAASGPAAAPPFVATGNDSAPATRRWQPGRPRPRERRDLAPVLGVETSHS